MGPGARRPDTHRATVLVVTLIAACVGADSAWMIGDAALTIGDGGLMVSATPKVARVGPWLVGAAGSAGACAALLHSPLPTEPRALLRRLERVAGDWEALLARPGELWLADSERVLERVSRPYWAIGSGGDVGLGALAALRARDPARLLSAAGRITAALRGDVCGPFKIVSM